MTTINQQRRNGTVWAAVGGVLMLLAVGGSFVGAMVTPMNQRIDAQRDQIREFKDELRRITDRERSYSQALATMSERFKEVETQFTLKGEVYETRFLNNERRISQSEQDGNPRHDERIKNLERINGITDAKQRK